LQAGALESSNVRHHDRTGRDDHGAGVYQANAETVKVQDQVPADPDSLR